MSTEVISEKILIGVVHFGPDALLWQLIESLSPEYKPRLRIVCHNPVPPEFYQEQIIHFGKNEGFARGMNRLIARAREEGVEVFIGLNNDARPEPESIEILASAILRGSVFMAQGLLIWKNERIAQGRNRMARNFFFTWSPDRNRYIFEMDNAPELVPTDFVCGAFFALKIPGNLPGVHDFEPQFFCYMEDIELSERLKKLGHQIALVPKAKAIHLESQSTGGLMSREGAMLRIHGLLTYLNTTNKNLGYRFISWVIFIPRILILWFRDGMK
ncbi:MAG: glycosyltransferase family 2 protein [Candidatus Cloacimonetes bacterium]|nr:glycosyltransferase family 2 protein [Candidatus Cloacimonadota bacterium]